MLKVAFLWHMHQPYYGDPQTGVMFLPWVRLHCLKDYYDLPARVGKFDRLKMTFNLVPSLVEQIDLYVERKTTDRHLELSTKPANLLTKEEKAEIFRTFFAANPSNMIEPYPYYRRLHKKLVDCGMDADLATRTATTQEIRDLTVWSNLVWIDPIFRDQPPFRELFDKGERYTEEDKLELIEAQFRIMSSVVPNYRTLMEGGKIEVSFSPYFHPILPLLCDTESAREALPSIALPKNRFCFPEDAERQVAMAVEMYRNKFGRDLEGMWPSEGSISEQMASILTSQGIKWMASDEQVLYGSIAKAGQALDQITPHTPYVFSTSHGALNIFFRDHNLSDKIGFVYSGWDVEKAVDDFMSNLHHLANLLNARDGNAVVPIILDGENCWEYYPRDGDAFLNLLFERLSADDQIETVTFSEASRTLKAIPLKNILAGSWINHNFRVWIGHQEDNTAWDLLWEARRTLVRFKEQNPHYDSAKIAAAERSLLVAEGSDWNWWYGDEHRGHQNEEFDCIYRAHLTAIYDALGVDAPKALFSPIASGFIESYISEPDGMVTPVIDGKLTHYYEWLGSGSFDCLRAGGTMHRASRAISSINFASDDEFVYLKADFCQKRFLLDNRQLCLVVKILSPQLGEFTFSANGIGSIPDWVGKKEDVLCGIGDVAEIGIKKSVFFPEGRGELYFKIGLTENGEEIELWPQTDPIRFKFYGRGEEIIWDL